MVKCNQIVIGVTVNCKNLFGKSNKNKTCITGKTNVFCQY
nr:MAG TPA: hypothetical protein [Caudoviricetes sp.]